MEVFMKKKIFSFIAFAVSLLSLALCLSGCFESVVPAAWVKLDMEGYVYYTANMYASGGDHIYLYETEAEAEADTYHTDYSIAVVFYPRILGADTIEGERTTTVDISSNYSMNIYINKSKSVYSATKKVYLNDQELPATRTDDLEYLLCLSFENFTFVRGNPNGQFNEFINKLEYK